MLAPSAAPAPEDVCVPVTRLGAGPSLSRSGSGGSVEDVALPTPPPPRIPAPLPPPLTSSDVTEGEASDKGSVSQAGLSSVAATSEAARIEEARNAFLTFETKGRGAVPREFVERAFQRMGGKALAGKALDPFTDVRTGGFRYEDFLKWLYSSEESDRPAAASRDTSSGFSPAGGSKTTSSPAHSVLGTPINERPQRLPPLPFSSPAGAALPRRPDRPVEVWPEASPAVPAASPPVLTAVERIGETGSSPAPPSEPAEPSLQLPCDDQVPIPDLAFCSSAQHSSGAQPPPPPPPPDTCFQADLVGAAPSSSSSRPPVPRFAHGYDFAGVGRVDAHDLAVVGRPVVDTGVGLGLISAAYAQDTPDPPSVALDRWDSAANTSWAAAEVVKPPPLRSNDDGPLPLLNLCSHQADAEPVFPTVIEHKPNMVSLDAPVDQVDLSSRSKLDESDQSTPVAPLDATGGTGGTGPVLPKPKPKPKQPTEESAGDDGEQDARNPRPSSGSSIASDVLVDEKAEFRKSIAALVVTCLCWFLILFIPWMASAGFEDPVCPEKRTALSCQPCGKGLVTFLPMFGEYERSMLSPLRVVLYFVAMMWLFQGIGTVCDKFMEGIEEMTSTERVVWVNLGDGVRQKKLCKVWNGTIANLTLMALGSSAPEILLNIIETCSGGYFSGELGPSTIVGSAAFNTLIIPAVCIAALPHGETRRILYMDVFVVTSVFSLFAYIWMVIILQYNTPDMVERWEALVTFLMFPLLLILSYIAEKGGFSVVGKHFHPRMVSIASAAGWTKAAGRVSPLEEDMDDYEEGPDAHPCRLSFSLPEVYFANSRGTLVVSVERKQGWKGRAGSCRFWTKPGSAQTGKDFVAAEGELHFQDGQDKAEVEITVLHNSSRNPENHRRFRLYLGDFSSGFVFDQPDGSAETGCFCDIVLDAGGAQTPMSTRVIEFSHGGQGFSLCLELWKEQFTSLLYVNGSIEEQAEAGLMDWALHCSGLFWKFFAAFVPPADILGGMACFCAALIQIGIVTAVVGDIASLLGCSTGVMSDDVTALTLVALGTSLPDTFASKAAAQQDDTADNAIGNVTGSNSVNVFLGVGVPYSLAAFYWWSAGPTQEWKDRTWHGKTFEELYLTRYPSGGFIVPAASLGFSVVLFTVCALVAIAVLMVRRVAYGGELGGPKFAQLRDGGILAVMWVVFIVAAILKSLGSK